MGMPLRHIGLRHHAGILLKLRHFIRSNERGRWRINREIAKHMAFREWEIKFECARSILRCLFPKRFQAHETDLNLGSGPAPPDTRMRERKGEGP